MDTKYWARAFWISMIAPTLVYPKNNPNPKIVDEHTKFYHSIQYTLPCERCKKEYSNIYQTDPVSNHLNSQDNLLKWITKVHNKVSQNIGKPVLQTNQLIRKYFPNYLKNMRQIKQNTNQGKNNPPKGLYTIIVNGKKYYRRKCTKCLEKLMRRGKIRIYPRPKPRVRSGPPVMLNKNRNTRR